MNVQTMVNLFLSWQLPKTFSPDCGISFKPLGPPNGWPIGTNLLTYDEAKSMFEHCIAGEQPASEAQSMRQVLVSALDRMDRARGILTDNNPRPECNWGMLDTYAERKALDSAKWIRDNYQEHLNIESLLFAMHQAVPFDTNGQDVFNAWLKENELDLDTYNYPIACMFKAFKFGLDSKEGR
jgi:hypothetical protein